MRIYGIKKISTKRLIEINALNKPIIKKNIDFKKCPKRKVN